MPVLDPNMNAHTIAGADYGFSATRIDRLGASEYTLVALAADMSGSVLPFRPDIERCIAQIAFACRKAPRADNLMLRLVAFDGKLVEVHGFKPLVEIDPAGYTGCLKGGGCTALYDAGHNAIEAVTRYGGDLTDHGFGVNAIVFVITDGEDNGSSLGARAVKQALQAARTGERIESLLTVLVGVNLAVPSTAEALRKFAKSAGFDQFIALEQADATTLAGLADFVSRHIDLQSRALGTGDAAALSLAF